MQIALSLSTGERNHTKNTQSPRDSHNFNTENLSVIIANLPWAFGVFFLLEMEEKHQLMKLQNTTKSARK